MTTPIPAGWKPIESAPKDGTEILAWREDCGQFIAKYTSADAFPMTQDELDAMDEETLFAKDWFTQWPDATRLDGSEAPTLWQPLPVDPCATCNDQGAVGNILNAEPCPDCSPASVAPGDAQDGLAEAQRLAQALFQRHFSQDEDYASGRVKWEVLGTLPGVLSQIDNMVSGLVRPDAPAAGDALDWYERRRELEPGMIFRTAHGVVKLDRGVPGDGTKWYVLDWNGDGWSAYDDTVEPGDLIGAPVADHPIAIELARTAALAAQVPQQGEA